MAEGIANLVKEVSQFHSDSNTKADDLGAEVKKLTGSASAASAPWTASAITPRPDLSIDSEIETAKAELLAAIQNMRAEAAAMFSVDLSSASYTCNRVVSVLGREISFCFDDYLYIFQYIGLGIMALAACFSLFVILR